MASNVVLEARSITAGYSRDQPVLAELDLELHQGEFLAIIGPSGCGKSTLLKVLQGLLELSAGELEGSAVSTSMVFQQPTLLPWATVLENALFGLKAQDRAAGQEDRAIQLLERMRLGEVLDRYPHQLSQGMRQRVNMARALLVEPDVLLLDEPFSALDVRTRRQLQDDLLELWRAEGLSVILVSHGLEEVVYLADRVQAMCGAPARLAEAVPIELERPRGQGAEARLAMWRVVEQLEEMFEE